MPLNAEDQGKRRKSSSGSEPPSGEEAPSCCFLRSSCISSPQECDLPRNDACSAEDAGYCPGPNGYTPGQPGEHLDLARPAWERIGKNADVTGILAIWFRQ
jgi:hypothetical protein